MPQLWSSLIKCDNTTLICPPEPIRVTNAALGNVTDLIGRTTVKLTYRPSGSESSAAVMTVLCTLVPRRIEQCTLNINLAADHEYYLTSVGENEVFLTGSIGVYHSCSACLEPASEPTTPLAISDRAIGKLPAVPSRRPEDPLSLSGIEGSHSQATMPSQFSESPKPKRKLSHECERPILLPSRRAEDSSSSSSAEGSRSQATMPSHFSASPKRSKYQAVMADAENKGPSSSRSRHPSSDEVTIFDGKVGSGQAPVRYNHRILVRFIERLDNADGPIVQKNTAGEPFSFTVGSEDVVKGFSRGVLGMREGGERRILVPSTLGYGEAGNQELNVPPGANLAIECKLMEVV